MDFFLDCARQPVFGHFQIVGGLKVHPEPGAGVEITSQAQGGIGRDSAPFVDNFGNPRHRHAQIEGEAIHAEAKRLHELRTQNLAGMNSWKKPGFSHDLLYQVLAGPRFVAQ